MSKHGVGLGEGRAGWRSRGGQRTARSEGGGGGCCLAIMWEGAGGQHGGNLVKPRSGRIHDAPAPPRWPP
jgi:hypothetical protein